MSPDQKAVRLAEVADEIQAARHLVDAGIMATENLPVRHREALSELLRTVATRLCSIVDDIRDARAAA